MGRIARWALVAASALILGGCLHAPMPWSPDGKWIAYVVEVRPIRQILRPGWTFGPSEGPTRPTPGVAPTSYQLWATRADTGVSVLLEESPRPLSAPGWSPDGQALAFGRLTGDGEGPSRFEVVVLRGPAGRRVLHSRPLPDLKQAEAPLLPRQAIVWSPDGRYLAVPQLSPRGLAIIRAENGHPVNAINDAFLPSWAPDGARLAFYVRGTGDALHCLDSPLGQPRMLADVGQAEQTPAWSRDGLSVVAVARRAAVRGVEPAGDPFELVRVRLDTGATETTRPMAADAATGRARPSQGVSIAFDRDGDNLYSTAVVEGLPNLVTWFRPRENAVYKKFAIVDQTAPTGSLSISPDGRTLAARVGPLDRLTPPALCDLDSPDLRSRLIAPDDSARVEWIATLVGSARSILEVLPVASAEPRAPASTRVDRPNLLPILTEFEPGSEATHRLRRIGKMGRPLCDRPEAAGPPSPEVAAILDEARLFFDYLREDYPAALASLEALEARAETPARRLDLLSIRAQIFINRGELARADRTITYLRDRDRKFGRRVEWTPGGYVVTETPAEGRGWPDYLVLRAGAVGAMLREEGPETHPNPDNPRFGLEPPRPRLPDFFPGERPFLEAAPFQPVRPGPRMRGDPQLKQ